MNAVVKEVTRDLARAISQDELQLPTLPEVALKIRETAEHPNVDVAKLAAVLGEDPSLAARIIKLANSPMLRGAQNIEDLHNAVSRLGIDFTANMAVGLAMQQMFQATSTLVDKKLRALWTHTTEVAAISAVLARQYTTLKPDQAMLAGLTHNIGALPILTWVEEHEGSVRDTFTLDEVIDRIHGEIGSRILSTWEFPEELIDVPRLYTDFTRQNPVADYIDIVTVANLQTYAGSDHPLAQIDWATVKSFENLGLDGSVESTEIEDLSAEMVAAFDSM